MVGPTVAERDTAYGETDLIAAVRDAIRGAATPADVAALVAQRPSAVNVQDAAGQTALHVAAEWAAPPPPSIAAAVVVSAVNSAAGGPPSPGDAAAARAAVVDTLLRAGANIAVVDASGATPLDAAPAGRGREAFVACVLRHRLETERLVQSVAPLFASRLMKRAREDRGLGIFSRVAPHCCYYLYKGAVYLWDTIQDIEHSVFQPRTQRPSIAQAEARLDEHYRKRSIIAHGGSDATYDASDEEALTRELRRLEQGVTLVRHFTVAAGLAATRDPLPAGGVVEWVMCDTGALVAVQMSRKGVVLGVGGDHHTEARRKSHVMGAAATYAEGTVPRISVTHHCAVRFPRLEVSGNVCCAIDGVRGSIGYVVAPPPPPTPAAAAAAARAAGATAHGDSYSFGSQHKLAFAPSFNAGVGSPNTALSPDSVALRSPATVSSERGERATRVFFRDMPSTSPDAASLDSSAHPRFAAGAGAGGGGVRVKALVSFEEPPLVINESGSRSPCPEHGASMAFFAKGETPQPLTLGQDSGVSDTTDPADIRDVFSERTSPTAAAGRARRRCSEDADAASTPTMAAPHVKRFHEAAAAQPASIPAVSAGDSPDAGAAADDNAGPGILFRVVRFPYLRPKDDTSFGRALHRMCHASDERAFEECAVSEFVYRAPPLRPQGLGAAAGKSSAAPHSGHGHVEELAPSATPLTPLTVQAIGPDRFVLFTTHGPVLADLRNAVPPPPGDDDRPTAGAPVRFTPLATRPEGPVVSALAAPSPAAGRVGAHPDVIVQVSSVVELLELQVFNSRNTSNNHNDGSDGWVSRLVPMMRLAPDRAAPHRFYPLRHPVDDGAVLLVFQSHQRQELVRVDLTSLRMSSVCRLPKPSSLRFFGDGAGHSPELPELCFAFSMEGTHLLRYNVSMHVLSIYGWGEIMADVAGAPYVNPTFVREPEQVTEKSRLHVAAMALSAAASLSPDKKPARGPSVVWLALQSLALLAPLASPDVRREAAATLAAVFRKTVVAHGGRPYVAPPPVRDDESDDGLDEPEDAVAAEPPFTAEWRASFGVAVDAARCALGLLRAALGAPWTPAVLAAHPARALEYRPRTALEKAHPDATLDGARPYGRAEAATFAVRGPPVRVLLAGGYFTDDPAERFRPLATTIGATVDDVTAVDAATMAGLRPLLPVLMAKPVGVAAVGRATLLAPYELDFRVARYNGNTAGDGDGGGGGSAAVGSGRSPARFRAAVKQPRVQSSGVDSAAASLR